MKRTTAALLILLALLSLGVFVGADTTRVPSHNSSGTLATDASGIVSNDVFWSGAQNFYDGAGFTLNNVSDPTKLGRFSLANNTTATTRTYSLPNATSTLGSVLNVNTTTQATTGTSEEILATYTLPANTLSANGKGVRITAHGTLAANGNTKVVRIRFGGIGGTTVTARSTVGNNVAWEATALIFRTGAATQIAVGRAFSSLDNVQLSDSAPTQTLANAIDIVVTGTTATAIGDLTFKSLIVESIN